MNKQIFLLVIINMFACMGYSFIAPLFPIMARNHGISESLLGYIIGIYPLTQICLSTLVPYGVKLLGRKRIMIYAGIFQATCVFCYGILNKLQNYNFLVLGLFALRILHACGSSVVCTLVYSVGPMVSTKENLQKDLAYLELGASSTGAIGPTLAGFFFNIGGFSFAFCALGIILCANVYLIKELDIDNESSNNNNFENNNNNGIQENNGNVSVLPYYKNFEIFLNSVNIILTVVEITFFIPVYTLHLINYWKLTIGQASIFFVINPISYIIGLQFLDWSSNKFGKYLSIISSVLLISLAALFLYPVFFLPHSKICIVIGFIINGFFSAFTIVPGLIIIKEILQKSEPNLDTGSVSDIASAIFNIGLCSGDVLGPVYGGMMTDYFGFQVACIVISLIGILIFFYNLYFYWENVNQNYKNFLCGISQKKTDSFLKESFKEINGEVNKRKGSRNSLKSISSHSNRTIIISEDIF